MISSMAVFTSRESEPSGATEKNEQHGHKKGLAVLPADLENGGLIPALLTVTAVHRAEHGYNEQPLEPGQRVRNCLIGFQALRHDHQPQQAHDPLKLFLIDSVFPAFPVGDLKEFSALEDDILRCLGLALEDFLCVFIGGV